MQTWLPSLRTEDPEQDYELAIKLARMAVKKMQPDDDVRAALRQDYANSADSLTAASHVVATHFQTVAAANDYWRD